jgi:hypothetical protein
MRCVHSVSLPRGRIQEIKHMVLVYLTRGLFWTWTQKSYYIYSSYITIFTRHIMSRSTQPLTSNNIPCFNYLENQLLFSWLQITIHPCLWSANNCPTLCFAPVTLSHPTVLHYSYTTVFKLHYLHRRHQQPRSSSTRTHRSSHVITLVTLQEENWNCRDLLKNLQRNAKSRLHRMSEEKLCQSARGAGGVTSLRVTIGQALSRTGLRWHSVFF